MITVARTFFRLVLAASGPVAAHAAADRDFRLPPGFEVTLYAGDDLAHDIHSMTTDHLGRIVVASRGWVKVLHDRDGDGRADEATVFAEFPQSGAQGMYFDAEGIVVSGDQAVRRWRDRDGDGRADGPPEIFFRAAQGEHGAHGIVKGPDGWFYLMAGNEAGIGAEHVKTAGSPVKRVIAGSVVRFSADGKTSEVIAHGFRNAYDLDFHRHGQLLTYDSDGERDHHLPWYSGTKIFDVAIGAEHGWVLRGTPHAWSRPEPWFDRTALLWDGGRGSPSGVVVYRHRTFPARYRDGVFALCWTLGRVYFLPLRPDGATFAGEVETFMAAQGNDGFAPVDAVVGRDGDLFIAIGGRGTMGGVFRVRHRGVAEPATETDPLRVVLAADQPLASWSRAAWVPQARALGAGAFVEAAQQTARPPDERIRAIEVLVELFDGVPAPVLERLADDAAPEVVARAAWAASRHPDRAGAVALLAALTRRNDPRIARAAWEGLLSAAPGTEAASDWPRGLGSPDRRVRAAALLAARGPLAASYATAPWPEAPTERQKIGRLKIVETAKLSGDEQDAYFRACAEALVNSHERDVRLDALRLLQIGLGDCLPVPGQPETFDGLLAARLEAVPMTLRAEIAGRLAPLFPTQDRDHDRELARVLAMLRAPAPEFLARVTEHAAAVPTIEDALHFLMAAGRLPGARSPEISRRTAQLLIALPVRMRAEGKEPSRYWAQHVGVMASRLATHDPVLGVALLAEKDFERPEHALLAAVLPAGAKEKAARLLLARVARAADGVWPREFTELVAVLPDAELFPALRIAWASPALHDSLALLLARAPQPEDRARFVAALGSLQPAVVEKAAQALAALGGAAEPAELAAALAALRRQCQFRAEAAARRALASLLGAWSGRSFAIHEGSDLLASYAPWFDWFAGAHPEAARAAEGVADESVAAWRRRLAGVDWTAGDAARGRRIHEERLCLRCHGAGRIGPDLLGVATRLSREDFFTAVLEPSRDISPAWQGREFTLRDGTVHVGTIVYESPAATLIQTGPDTTLRLEGGDIASVQPSRVSLMPPNLLNGLSDTEVADFYAFVRTLKK